MRHKTLVLQKTKKSYHDLQVIKHPMSLSSESTDLEKGESNTSAQGTEKKKRGGTSTKLLKLGSDNLNENNSRQNH